MQNRIINFSLWVLLSHININIIVAYSTHIKLHATLHFQNYTMKRKTILKQHVCKEQIAQPQILNAWNSSIDDRNCICSPSWSPSLSAIYLINIEIFSCQILKLFQKYFCSFYDMYFLVFVNCKITLHELYNVQYFWTKQ